jgi:tryptophanyl-tRNA synthetase
MDVCVLVADLQSLDVVPEVSLASDADRLTAVLRERLPESVRIVRESDVPSLPALAICASRLLAAHHLRRVGPLRKLIDRGQPISLPTLLYPAMMIANVLAFDATHVLAKPEGRFQHHDVLNDALRRGPLAYGWPRLELTPYSKPRVDMPSGDGSGPMKRNKSGALYVTDVDDQAVGRWVDLLPGPPDPRSRDRSARCAVVQPVWRAINHYDPARQDYVMQQCVQAQVSCADCRANLAGAILADLASIKREAARDHDHAYLERVDYRATQLIEQATGAGTEGSLHSGQHGELRYGHGK